MHILYVSQYFPPEMGAPAARVYELSRHWVKAGHRVTVLTGFPNHPTGVVFPEYRRRLWRLACTETVDGIEVVRTWLWPLPNRKSYERLFNYLSFCFSSSLRGSFVRGPEVVIGTTPPLFVGLAGRWIAGLRHTPFVLEVRDIWPDSIVASGMGNERSVGIRLMKRLAGYLYRHASHITVVTHAFQSELASKYGVPPHKMSVVPNGVDVNLFSPHLDGAAAKARVGLGDKFVVSYMGTLGLAQGLETVVRAAERLARILPDVVFVFVGEGADKGRLVKLVRELELTNVLFVPQQLRRSMPEWIRAADVCLVVLRRAEIFRTVLPSKMLEFMACGRPVVLAVDGVARELIEEAGAGLFVEPGDSAALADAIASLRRDPGLRARLGERGRSYAVSHLSRERTAEQYLDVLSRVVNVARVSAHPA